MTEDRPFVYTEVDSYRARIPDRLDTLAEMWALSLDDCTRRERRAARVYAVKYALNPFARVSWIIDSGGE